MFLRADFTQKGNGCDPMGRLQPAGSANGLRYVRRAARPPTARPELRKEKLATVDRPRWRVPGRSISEKRERLPAQPGLALLAFDETYGSLSSPVVAADWCSKKAGTWLRIPGPTPCALAFIINKIMSVDCCAANGDRTPDASNPLTAAPAPDHGSERKPANDRCRHSCAYPEFIYTYDDHPRRTRMGQAAPLNIPNCHYRREPGRRSGQERRQRAYRYP